MRPSPPLNAPVLQPGNQKFSHTISYYLVFTVFGMLLASLGPSLPYLAEQLRASIGQISYLIVGRSVGYLLGTLLASRLYDLLPGHKILAAKLLGMAVLMALVPFVPYVWVLAGVLVLIGIGMGGVDVGGNTLLVWLHGRKAGPYLNGMFFFAGLGAFLAPVLVTAAVLSLGDVYWAYWGLALLLVPPGLWLAFLKSPEIQKANSDVHMKSANTPLLVLFSLFLFLYIGAEAVYGDWVYTYAISTGLADAALAAYLTSTFWIAITLGRLLGVPLATRFDPRRIIAVDIVGMVAGFGLILLFQDSLAVTWIGTGLVGISMASIFPTTLAFAERHMHISGRVTGWMFSGGSLGGLFLPWLVGQLFEPLGPASMMVTLFVNSILAGLVLMILNVFVGRRKEEDPGSYLGL
jgi:MFS transporter, FHS family, Na+ dependent glucose transporter 1